jgi:hypothetical protein
MKVRNSLQLSESDSGCRTPISLAVAILIGIALFGTNALAQGAGAGKAPMPTPRGIADYGKLPLSFEANQGQTDKQVKFLSRGPGYALFLTPTETVLSLKDGHNQQARRGSLLPVSSGPKVTASKAAVLRIRLDHANSNVKISGIDELPGKSNYFIGNDPAKWRRDIPTFGRVKYQEVVCCESFIGDGGRPPEVGLQGQASNRHKLRG